MINSQTDLILSYLLRKKSNTLNPVEALRMFRCMRLGARIYDIKKRGYRIETKFVKNGNKRYANYRLIQEINNK